MKIIIHTHFFGDLEYPNWLSVYIELILLIVLLGIAIYAFRWTN